jgi:hypothetical protein
MANQVLLKKSSVAAKVPLIGDLAYGELAINYADGKLYYKDSTNTIKYFLESSQVSSTLDDITTNGNTTTNSITVGGLSIGSAYTFPTIDGSNGQVLTTDGLGNITFQTPAGGAGSAASDLTITSNTFTGTGSTTNYTLSQVAAADTHVIVSLNGVVQDPAEYSVSGTTLSFTTAPALNDNVELRTFSRDTANITLRDYAKFVYTITATTSSITGADDNSVTLAYDVGFVDVYQNGIRLVNSDDYTATNGTSITLTTAALSGDTIEVISYGRAYINDPRYVWQPSTVALTTTTSNQVISTFIASDYDTAKYICQAKITGEIHATEIMIMHDGTDVFTTEYGTMWSNASLGTFSADLSGGNIRLLFTPANVNTTVKIKRVLI